MGFARRTGLGAVPLAPPPVPLRRRPVPRAGRRTVLALAALVLLPGGAAGEEPDARPRAGLKPPAISAVDPGAIADPGRFDGRWTAGAALHYSSPKIRCGFQIIRLGILDGRVKGKLHIGSTHFRDAAAGDYSFVGTVDKYGNLQAEGRGVSIVGQISGEDLSFSGSWDAFGVGCRGTYEGAKQF